METHLFYATQLMYVVSCIACTVVCGGIIYNRVKQQNHQFNIQLSDTLDSHKITHMLFNYFSIIFMFFRTVFQSLHVKPKNFIIKFLYLIPTISCPDQFLAFYIFILLHSFLYNFSDTLFCILI